MAAMGADSKSPPPTSTWVVTRGEGMNVPFEAELCTEDGGSVRVRGRVAPGDLPLGYHRMSPLDPAAGGDVRLIVTPGVCPLPDRMWGWAVQLYAARSRASWGMGDLSDLRRIAHWSRSLGAGMVLINPIHAATPAAGQQPSPYFPSSRRWRNPIYLRIEEVPGAADVGGELEVLSSQGRSLNDGGRIDRDAVWRLKRAALEAIWSAWRASGRAEPGSDVDRWVASQGAPLWEFSTWSALTDELGPDWRRWPGGYQRPDGPAVAAFAAEHPERVRFFAWLQWLVEEQLAAATGAGAALVTDLAIGADPGGADAWQWQEVLVPGVTVGAPPDEFSPAGQDWGLPPFDPWRLRACGYEPFAQIVRAAMAGGGGVRFDHVAGLFRLFWVPTGAGAVGGVYVRYPWRDLLGVLALEAHRAGAFVVGEDLGTVEPEAREALVARHVLSYRLLWFEDRRPADWPQLALAAVTTHDLPTIAGVWTGADMAARRSIGLTVDDKAEHGLRERLREVCGGEDALAVPEVVGRAYEALSAAPSLLAAATLDDALGVVERPNQPGTVEEWPNWSIPLPLPLEEIEVDTDVLAVAQALDEGRSRGPADRSV